MHLVVQNGIVQLSFVINAIFSEIHYIHVPAGVYSDSVHIFIILRLKLFDKKLI